MDGIGADAVLSVFLVFCRIGGCLLVAPGLSSARIPVQVRLFAALAISLALTPTLAPSLRPALGDGSPSHLFRAIGGELLVGFLIGLLARLFLLALSFVAVTITQYAGFGIMPGVSIDGEEPLPPVAAMFTLTGAAVVFAADLHWELVRGLVQSYAVVPPMAEIDVRGNLVDVTDQLRDVFLLVLRVASPFLVYGVIVNLAIGITNKLTPQIPVFFIALPFVLAGGLALMAATVQEMMLVFLEAFGTWLSAG